MNVEIFEGDPKQWDGYVSSHPNANIYHLYFWGIFLRDYYNFKPVNLVVYDGNAVSGIAPLVFVE